MTAPILSIGLPVFNGEKFLEETLEGLLAQTHEDFELVISDNASKDGTEALCREFAERDGRILYLRYEENRGAAWNFNNTFRQSRGKYFKWAAHDDLHMPSFLERCVEVLERDPEVALCFTGTRFIDSDGRGIRRYEFPIDVANEPRHVRFRFFAGGGHIVHEIFGVIRSDVLRQTALIGGYLGSDLVLLGDIALRGRLHQVPEVLFLHREHSGRSMLNPQGAENMTQWYDATRSGKLVFPHWKRARMNLATVFRVPLPFKDRLLCVRELARAWWWSRSRFSSELRLPISRHRR